MANILFGLFFLVLSVVTFLETRGFSKLNYSVMNSATFPRIVALLMAFFSFIVIFRGLKAHFHNNKKDNTEAAINRYGAFGIAVTLVYVLLVGLLGFLIPTILILMFYSVYLNFGKFRLVDTLLIPGITTILVVVMFLFLNIPLMRGSLF